MDGRDRQQHRTVHGGLCQVVRLLLIRRYLHLEQVGSWPGLVGIVGGGLWRAQVVTRLLGKSLSDAFCFHPSYGYNFTSSWYSDAWRNWYVYSTRWAWPPSFLST